MIEGLTPQRPDVLICQVCGRTGTPGEAHWLNQPHKDILGLNVQRCPQHWTDWALRNTRDGRTNENRAAMREALAQPVPTVHPYVEPYSLSPFPDGEEDAVAAAMEEALPGDKGNGHGVINRRAQAMKIMKNRRKTDGQS